MPTKKLECQLDVLKINIESSAHKCLKYCLEIIFISNFNILIKFLGNT